jgi:predicted O-linked N-acetylglucosamine transferase (SPINDLY family)
MATLTAEQFLQVGIQHHQANRLDEAESIYRQILARFPDHPGVLYLLGRLLAQRNQLEPAVRAVQRAVELQPSAADSLNLLGELLRRSGRVDEAMESHRRAGQVDPKNADAPNGMGNCLREKGDQQAALEQFRRAIQLKPEFAEAHSNLGNALRAVGQLEASIAEHGEAARLKPQSAEILNNYGIALKEQGRYDEAIAVFQKSVQIRPQYPEVLNNLGSTLILRDRLEEAIDAFSRAAQLNPNAAEIQNNLGNVLQKKGMLDESVAAYRRALAIRPDYAETHSNLGINLSAQGKLDEAIASFRNAMTSAPDNAQYHGNILCTMHFHPGYTPKQILEEHRRWNEKFVRPLVPANPQFPKDPNPNRRRRIGYVSPDFRHHPVGRFLVPLFRHHDHASYEIFAYAGVRAPDDLTEFLKARSDHWRDTLSFSDNQLAQQIRDDKIDILVDVTLHMAYTRLLVFAQKPAPVQVTWLGYVSTTGLETMDYRISDVYLDPPGSDGNYVEKTIRLPHCNWCYEPPDGIGEPGPLPAASKGYVTFCCFNNFCKVTGPTLQLWSRILAAVPNSRLIIHSGKGSHQDDVRKVFGIAGVAAERISFVGFLPTLQYLRQHQQVDIGLDPIPYAGGTTTCDALWMGVPVITLAGQTAVARAGVSLLTTVGLPELIARSEEEYLGIAVKLARDLSGLARLRGELRGKILASSLTNGGQFARDMEGAFREMWKNWCAERKKR